MVPDDHPCVPTVVDRASLVASVLVVDRWNSSRFKQQVWLENDEGELRNKIQAAARPNSSEIKTSWAVGFSSLITGILPIFWWGGRNRWLELGRVARVWVGSGQTQSASLFLSLPLPFSIYTTNSLFFFQSLIQIKLILNSYWK